MRTIRQLLMTMLVVISDLSIASAYDTERVHSLINENALYQSGVDIYLKERLGISKGISERIIMREATEWFNEGAKQEDLPTHRSNNHFQDPLKAWDSAGLSGSYVGSSSIVWAQDQSLLGFYAGGNWSWKTARDSYYEALRSAQKATREQKFADCFRSLGQVMHLIADSSVPAHTRNDIHVFPLEFLGMRLGKRQTYESWAAVHSRNLNYLAKSIDQSFFTHAVANSNAPLPISALWDQDVYSGLPIQR